MDRHGEVTERERKRDELVMHGQTEKEQKKKGSDKDKDISHVLGGFASSPLQVDLDTSHTDATVSWCVWPCVCVGLLVVTGQIMTQQKFGEIE